METVWANLRQYYDFAWVTYNPGLHSFAKDADVSRAYQYPTADIERYKRTFVNFLSKSTVSNKPLIIDSRNSYPEGFGVGNLAHPDLALLTHFDGVLFDLRVLALYRDPSSCTLSAVRRFKVKEFQYKNFEFQARSAQEALTLINNALPLVKCGKYMVMRYEQFVKEPLKFSARLAELASVDQALLESCFGDLVESKHAKAAPSAELQTQRQHLDHFFAMQKVMWPILAGDVEAPPLSITRPKLVAIPPEQRNVRFLFL